MTYQVLATYTAGEFQGLIGANGYFYAPAADGSNYVADLLKLTPQGGITRNTAILPALPYGFWPTVFVNNTLYGATQQCYGNADCVFAIGDGSFRAVSEFLSPYPLGYAPIESLTYANGTFYGVNQGGGTGAGAGTVFSVTAAGSGLLLYNFGQPYFENSSCRDTTYTIPTIAKVAGTLYGVVPTGGAYNKGFFYAINLVDDSFRVLHNFGGRFDAATPCGLVNANGAIYGISNSGDGNYGTLFAISLGGFSSVLHAFSPADGASPWGLLAANGKLFGVSYGGLRNYEATVWEYAGSGFRVLHSFAPTTPNELPLPQLVYMNGTLYGVTPNLFFAISGV